MLSPLLLLISLVLLLGMTTLSRDAGAANVRHQQENKGHRHSVIRKKGKPVDQRRRGPVRQAVRRQRRPIDRVPRQEEAAPKPVTPVPAAHVLTPVVPAVPVASAVATAAAAAPKSAEPPPSLLARCGFTPASRKRIFSHMVYVLDEQTQTPLFELNQDTVWPIASLSKLMTAVVWLSNNKEPMSGRLEVTDDDLDTLKQTHSRLGVGAELTRAEMLHIALMSSENRAAAALSRDYPGGRPAFIAAMNAKAQQLGMKNTSFVNATGLSPQNVSTAKELATLVEVANGYQLIRRYTVDKNDVVHPGRGQLQYINSNRLIRYGQVDASVQKTGFINESGHNMVMRLMVHNQRPVIVTMLGSDSPEGVRLDGVRIAQWLSCSLH